MEGDEWPAVVLYYCHFLIGDLFLGNLDLDMLYTKVIYVRLNIFIINKLILIKLKEINGGKNNQFSCRG